MGNLSPFSHTCTYIKLLFSARENPFILFYSIPVRNHCQHIEFRVLSPCFSFFIQYIHIFPYQIIFLYINENRRVLHILLIYTSLRFTCSTVTVPDRLSSRYCIRKIRSFLYLPQIQTDGVLPSQGLPLPCPSPFLSIYDMHPENLCRLSSPPQA